MVASPQGGHDERQARLSALIETVLDEAQTRPVRFGELVDRTAERGYGLWMILLGLPMLIPVLPPGSSTVVGPIYAVFAVQMLLGQPRPWVPVRFRQMVLGAGAVRALRERGVPWIRRLERLSRPRWAVVPEKVVLRAAGVMVFLMGVILLSPLPFLNTLPAIAVMLIGMGLLNRDALFMLAGLGVGVVSLALAGLSAGLIVVMIQRLRATLGR
ncbi:MAG: exopolysaccharide biosynthesis protein [Armatimonadota bacterium]|nr:exopolysaccharide biosynthesis protein [Armatimonadota bacterium]MDR7519792.1 exopolysaccharide biosynthesis protein [Armatimonadota bacterium]MDR7549557.1 exopolysaccharide biosynthesis protein [Armatimonadota bacterium]